jgi:hypothetical protein
VGWIIARSHIAAAQQTTAERELRSTVRVDGFLVPIGDRRKNT